MKLTTQFATVFMAVAGVAFSQNGGQLDAQRQKQAQFLKDAQLARGDYNTCVETHQLTGPPVPTPHLACVDYLIVSAYYKGMAAAVDKDGFVPGDKFAQLMAQQKAALKKANDSRDAALARNNYLSCLSSPGGLANPSSCQRFLNEAEKYDKVVAQDPGTLPQWGSETHLFTHEP